MPTKVKRGGLRLQLLMRGGDWDWAVQNAKLLDR